MASAFAATELHAALRASAEQRSDKVAAALADAMAGDAAAEEVSRALLLHQPGTSDGAAEEGGAGGSGSPSAEAREVRLPTAERPSASPVVGLLSGAISEDPGEDGESDVTAAAVAAHAAASAAQTTRRGTVLGSTLSPALSLLRASVTTSGDEAEDGAVAGAQHPPRIRHSSSGGGEELRLQSDGWHSANVDADGSANSGAPPVLSTADVRAQFRAVQKAELLSTGRQTASRSPDDPVALALRLLLARAAAAALAETIDALVQLLLPIEGHLAFWRFRDSQPFVEWLESGPLAWWRDWRERPTRTAPETMIQELEALQAPVLTALGELKRTSLMFKVASSDAGVRTVVSRTIQLLEATVRFKPGQRGLSQAAVAREQRTRPAHGGHDAYQSPMASMEHIFYLVDQLPVIQRHAEVRVHACRKRSWAARHWLGITAAALGLTVGGIQLYRNRRTAVSKLSHFVDSARVFWVEHVKEPLIAISDELFNGSKLARADREALKDAERSMQSMLKQYLEKRYPHWSSRQVERVSAAMDMEPVSRRYESEMEHPIRGAITGDLLQLILMQVQFIKKEVMSQMTTMDTLLRENEMNLQIMATIPAFLLTYFGFASLRSLYRRATRPRSTRELTSMIQLCLRDVDRLLNLTTADAEQRRNSTRRSRSLALSDAEEDIAFAGAGKWWRRQDVCSVPFRGLTNHDLGVLVLLIARLCRLCAEYKEFVEEAQWMRVQQDLADLTNEELTPHARKETIKRMYLTYSFLQPAPPASRLPSL